MFFFDTDVKIILNCNFLYSNVKNLRSFGKSTFGWRGLVIHGLVLPEITQQTIKIIIAPLHFSIHAILPHLYNLHLHFYQQILQIIHDVLAY